MSISVNKYIPDGILNRLFLYLKTFGFIVFATLLICACSGKQKSLNSDNDATVVVTNSWTAAYAQAAGAENIVILAPFEMAHPAEYELRPSDIPKLMKATVIVVAGYEVMMERLKVGLDLPPDKLLPIKTDYNYANIEQSVMSLAVRLGTESVARENLMEIRRAIEDGRQALSEKGITQKAIVHHFHVPIAQELGLVPDVIFGPAAPEISDIVTVSKSDAVIIIDNSHNPVGQSFKEVLQGARYKQFLNFPGMYGTKTLSDVIRYNVAQLVSE